MNAVVVDIDDTIVKTDRRRHSAWCRVLGREIPFRDVESLSSEEILKKYTFKLDDKMTHHLYQQYGRGAIEIMNLIVKEPSLGNRIVDGNDFIKAEIIYVLRHELATHLIDVFCRRTEMSLFIDHRKAPEAVEIVADLMAKEYSWSEEKKKIEIQNYLEYVKRTISFI